MKIRVILSDDHPTVLSGVRHELARVPTVEIVGSALGADELLALLERSHCDVLITDYAMPGGAAVDGLPLLRQLRRGWPAMKVVVLTTIDNPALLKEIAKTGVQGLLSKIDEVDHLIAATHAVYAGANYQSPSVREKLAVQASSARTVEAMTTKEAEVIRLYVSGLSISEIAAQLNRAKQTVSAQKGSAMRKLGIERDADLFQYAYETGLVATGPKDAG
ncbi:MULTISPECIES: response regulator transcription factor [Burkholderia]|uniref:response regulator transcription factor n=1 Tax=Burkholderia TaxID=32008 RepID=UPI0011993939|nr:MULTISPECIES: response regulator transcription factor [Burkholderia]MBU9197495.1 response regulator transcription factor [Burkholderia gladioli]MDN7740162.1 response regulator transcription factor [Burkholderia gladioli]MDN7918735.1 response regulator transcription factor [Burkholderia gladioli]TWC68595.1 LuxR family two component transcriptional regulator [Burkholderia sp. SJZ089]TWD00410.1 LuxR family two component transcriptional regulator [Burkholderia sp. SJZ115]